MEYVNYGLVVLATLIALLICLHLPSRSRLSGDQVFPASLARQRQLARKKKNQQMRAAKPLDPEQHPIELDRDLSEVPTPWGWPHSEKNSFEGGQAALVNGQAHSISDSLHHWADKLAQGKHTVDNEEYKHKKERSMRVLMEDRYGRSSRTKSTTHATRSGVTTTAHDQMDNSSSGQVEKVEARFTRKGESAEISRDTRQPRLKMQTGLENVKMPWGW